MIEAVTITPTLLLGPPEAAEGRHKLIPVETADDAFQAICNGLSALLPPDAWDAAAETLRRLGADEEWIAGRLQHAGH